MAGWLWHLGPGLLRREAGGGGARPTSTAGRLVEFLLCSSAPASLPTTCLAFPVVARRFATQYYDSEIKQRLLRYATSALLFAESRVNPQLISWNRGG